ncbi:MAG: phospholipase D-like domain-containing protein, partial [Christensenella sp.]
MDSVLKSGVYEQLINKSLRQKLNFLHDAVIRTEKLDGAESSVVLAKYLCEVLQCALSNIDCADKDDTRARIEFANKIISAISQETGDDDFAAMEVDEASEELTACIRKENNIYALYPNMEIPRPKTSLAESSLFTGSEKEPPLFSELKAEIKSCDRIDMLVSFIKWSGLRLIIDELEKFTQKGGRLRVITTTYMGATDAKAVEKLASLPNTEIMISYNTASTRLHAKAYLFVRDTGFTTSYIGSSNLSKAALSSGLEWNLKVTQKDMPQ